MKTIVFEVMELAETAARTKRGRSAKYARHTFDSVESMARVLTPTRWAIVQALTGAEPMGVRELSRRVNRDVKGVHVDAHALVAAGVISRTDDGKFSFPFGKVKVQFELRALVQRALVQRA